MNENSYIYKKEVNWSLLNAGLTIPVSIQLSFQNLINSYLPRGITKSIHLILDNEKYIAKLVNQKFDEEKYPTHKDIIQIRYSPKSQIAVKLKLIFHISYKYIKTIRDEQNIRKKSVSIPYDMREYLVLYTTKFQDTFLLDYITADDSKKISSYLSDISEEEFELETNYNKVDLTAKIEHKSQVVKIRKLDRSICDDLKLLYDNKCQICNHNFGEVYNGNIAEAHHIDHFTISLNNNSDNIIIICPNHHRIIHKVKPLFDRNYFHFIYPNGLKETIMLNKHL